MFKIYFILTTFFLILSSSIALSADEIAIEKMINNERVNRQLNVLTIDEKLQCAAKLHVLDISVSRQCKHQGKDGSYLKNRLKKCGYDLGIGEQLLACNFASPEAALKALMDAPKQKQILFDKRFEKIGCSESKNFYVCVMVK